jgi:hypothetical protein
LKTLNKMAQTGSITLFLRHFNEYVDFPQLLNAFNGKDSWIIGYNNTLAYLPLNDEDFCWVHTDKSMLVDVLQLLIQKYKHGEIVGFFASYLATNIVIEVLIYPDTSKITFGIYVNRKTINSFDVTDFSWYLDKILPIFVRLNIVIEAIECIDG